MRYAVLCGRLLTGADDGILRGAVVGVAGDEVVRVDAGPGAAPEPGEQVIDLRTATVLPGLIDLHNHLNGDGKYSIGDDSVRPSEATWAIVAAHYARIEVLRGVTTVRVPGAPHNVDVALREAVAEGYALGPRLICAGEKLSMTGGHGFGHGREVDGPAEVMKATRDLIKAGVDYIKLTASGGVGITRPGEQPVQPEMTVEEMAAAARVAHATGLRVTAHANGVPAIRNCIEAGLDCIEHGIYMGAREAEAMAARGMALVPTLSVMRGIAFRGRALGLPASWIPIAEGVIEPHMASFRAALDAGVPFGPGTDGYGDLIEELEIFVEAGLTRYRAIQAATRDAGRLIGPRRRLGVVAQGFAADLIAVHGDPLEDLQALRAPAFVMAAGRVVTA